MLTGCESLNHMSSGPLGCSPEEITIIDDGESGFNTRTWTAECKNKIFYCSKDRLNATICKENLK